MKFIFCGVVVLYGSGCPFNQLYRGEGHKVSDVFLGVTVCAELYTCISFLFGMGGGMYFMVFFGSKKFFLVM